MEPVGSMVDKLKGFGKSGCDFVDGLFRRRKNSYSRNPIEILKRLQRESFSDLMKIRDRQDKVERVLTFYKTPRGTPFQESGTRVKGDVDVLGAILIVGDPNQQHPDLLGKAGIRTGVGTRFAFETSVRENDTLLAEFVANKKETTFSGDSVGSSLNLSKVLYMANINDWFSAIAIPIGAQCRDIVNYSSSSHQGKGLTDLSSYGPPLLLNQQPSSAVGMTVRKSNIIAALSQSVPEIGMQTTDDEIGHHFSTFAQLICHLPKGIKLSLMGLQQNPKLSRNHINFAEESTAPVETSRRTILSSGSLALKLESELDECAQIIGWIEMKNSNTKNLSWGVTLSDDNSEEYFGWGMSVNGITHGPKNWDRLQVESYVKVNLAKKFSLQPGFVYAMEKDTRMLALMLKSNWSF